jgi:hypothetical protein
MAWTNVEMAEFERRLKQKNPNFERFIRSSLHNLIALLKTASPTKDAVQQELDRISDKKDAKYKDALNYLRRNFPGLDEVVRGGLKLRGFTGINDEQNRMDRAVLAMGRCHEVVGMCQKAIAKVIGNSVTAKNPAQWSAQETKATELFQKWLDHSRAVASVNRVRTVFNSMEQALVSQNWEIVVYGTPEDPDPDNLGPLIAGAFAYVIPSENAYRSIWAPASGMRVRLASTLPPWRTPPRLRRLSNGNRRKRRDRRWTPPL